MTVPWITGRKFAVARCLAVEVSKAQRIDWTLMTSIEKERRIGAALETIDTWVRNEVVIQFENEYREPDPDPPKHRYLDGAKESDDEDVEADVEDDARGETRGASSQSAQG